MIFIYGGSGALGKDVVTTFNKYKFSTISVDLVENKEATHNIIVKGSFEEISKQVEKELSEILKGQKIDHVFNVAGGWVGGSISSGKLVENCEKMWKSSVETSIITTQIASKHMKR